MKQKTFVSQSLKSIPEIANEDIPLCYFGKRYSDSNVTKFETKGFLTNKINVKRKEPESLINRLLKGKHEIFMKSSRCRNTNHLASHTLNNRLGLITESNFEL